MKKTACVLALLLALVTINLAPVTARASQGEIYVGGTDISGGSYFVNDGHGGITTAGASWDNYNVYYISDTVYLKNAQITKTYEDVSGVTACIYASDPISLTINSINSFITNTDTGKMTVYGVYSNGSLAFSGTLTATAATASNQSYGIFANGSISISSGALVTANSGTAGSSRSVSCNGITVEGGTLTATAGTASGQNCTSLGIYSSGNVMVSSGTLTANGGAASGHSCLSSGVLADDNINVSGGALTGNGGAASDIASNSCGALANGSINVSGGALTGTGGAASNSCGALANGSINVSGGALTGTGGAASNSFGVNGFSGIAVSGGEFTAKASTATDYSCGVHSSGITLTGGHTIAQCGAAQFQRLAFIYRPSFVNASQTNIIWYQWRTAENGAFTQSATRQYQLAYGNTYVEITPSDAPPTPPTPEITSGGLITYTYEDWLRDNQYDQMAPPSGLKADTASPDVVQPATTPAPAAPVTVAPATSPAVLADTTPPPQTADSATLFGFVMLAVAAVACVAVMKKRA